MTNAAQLGQGWRRSWSHLVPEGETMASTINGARLACKGHRVLGDYAVTRALDAARDVLEGSGGGAPKAAAQSAAFNALGLPPGTVDTIERELSQMIDASVVPEFRRTIAVFDSMRRARVRSSVNRPPRITRPHRAQRAGRSA